MRYTRIFQTEVCGPLRLRDDRTRGPPQHDKIYQTYILGKQSIPQNPRLFQSGDLFFGNTLFSGRKLQNWTLIGNENLFLGNILFSGRKLQNSRLIQSEDFFLENTLFWVFLGREKGLANRGPWPRKLLYVKIVYLSLLQTLTSTILDPRNITSLIIFHCKSMG